MRSHGIVGKRIDRQVFLVEIVDSGRSFAEEFTSAMAKQFVDSRREESDNMSRRLEAFKLG